MRNQRSNEVHEVQEDAAAGPPPDGYGTAAVMSWAFSQRFRPHAQLLLQYLTAHGGPMDWNYFAARWDSLLSGLRMEPAELGNAFAELISGGVVRRLDYPWSGAQTVYFGRSVDPAWVPGEDERLLLRQRPRPRKAKPNPPGWDGAGRVWRGYSLDDPTPLGPVVYVLYDVAAEPCYVGSTNTLAQRLAAHSQDKSFTAWTAWGCKDREHAFSEEDRLLKEHMPYLNVRQGR